MIELAANALVPHAVATQASDQAAILVSQPCARMSLAGALLRSARVRCVQRPVERLLQPPEPFAQFYQFTGRSVTRYSTTIAIPKLPLTEFA